MRGTIAGKTAFLLLSALLLGMLCGCGGSEKTKTIILPDKTGNLGSGAINIRNIQEYSYEGNSAERGNMTLNERGNLCLIVPLDEVGYEFQEITLSNQQIVCRIPIKETSIANIQLAPGGRYVSYEVIEKEARQLIVLGTEDEESIVLHQWSDPDQMYMYQWSGDGSTLFSWEDGVNFAQDAINWYIRQYHLENNVLESESEMLMEGSGNAWRQILPNYDGSQAFVRERYMDGFEANWLIGPDMDTYYPLYTSSEINRVVKFSQKGLHIVDGEGNLRLITNFIGKSEEQTLMPLNNMALDICEKGDHIFLIEKDSSGKVQLSGIQVQNGVLVEKQVLYKNIDADVADIKISQDDKTVLMQNCKYLEDDRCLFTVTVLEYVCNSCM